MRPNPVLDRLMAELSDGQWHLVGDDPQVGIRRFVLVEHVNGKFQVHVKTENYATRLILDANARSRSNTAGRRWGDGQRVASIPLDIWNKHLQTAHNAGDEAYVAKFLNDSDNAALRTFDGVL